MGEKRVVRVEVEHRQVVHGEIYMNKFGNLRKFIGLEGSEEEYDVLLHILPDEPQDTKPDGNKAISDFYFDDPKADPLADIASSLRIVAKAMVMRGANEATALDTPDNPNRTEIFTTKDFDKLLAGLGESDGK